MCGIAGILNIAENLAPPSPDLLSSMIGTLRHRGPDEFGCYRDNNVGLVNARLSIIDLTTGSQPICNEDENLWCVYNGEVFNYLELRESLRKLGHRFKTGSDTEVVLHAWEEWGRECFDRFNGQWAVAIWDRKRKTLVLSRDRFGVRPLFVHRGSGRLRFASEVKALLVDPDVPRRIDLRGLDQVFTFWTTVAPATIFEEVEELRPGSARQYTSGGSMEEWQYWRLEFPAGNVGRTNISQRADSPSMAEAADVLRRELETATRLRLLRSDVPVGCYLSGGLDSSLTAYLARQAHPGDLKTFSIRFEDPEFDEGRYQRLMAETLETDHREIVVRRHDIADSFPAVLWHTEKPILRTAPVPMFLLSGLVRDSGIKAVLTGEGADELLAGYDIFRSAKIREFWSRFPESKVRPMLLDRLYPYLRRSPAAARGMALAFWKQGLEGAGTPGFSHEPRWRTTSTLKRFFSREVREIVKPRPGRPTTSVEQELLAGLPGDFRSWDTLAQAQYLEMMTLFPGYLLSSQGDRMLMSHSVEGRFPFLDVNVAAFCNGLPPGLKLAGLKEKAIVKRAAAGIVPEQIINRPKQPYRAPDAACFVTPGAPEYVAEMLSDDAVRRAGLFDPDATRGLYRKCRERIKGDENAGFGNSDNMGVVGILSAQLLWHMFAQGKQALSPDGAPVLFKRDVNHVT